MNGLMRANMRVIAVFLAAFGVLGSVAAGAPGVLTNGVPVSDLSGTPGSEVFYMIDVPSGQDELEISMTGGAGDCDLYVRKDAEPTTTTYDYRPYKIGNEETVTVASPAAGTWYIMLKGYTAYSGLTLTATYSASTSVVPLKSGLPVMGLAGARNTELYFSIEVPSGQSELDIAISGGTGDCDLYVKAGALPTTSDYDYRPFKLGNEEAVTVANPAAGTWYIMLRAYDAYAGLTLLAAYDGGLGVLLENGVPVTDLRGALDSEALYRIEVPEDQNNLEISITGGTGDCDLYVRYGTPPTLSEWDERPLLAGKDEEVWIVDPAPGTWYIMLHGSAAYDDVTLTAAYDDVPVIEDEVPIEELDGTLGSETFFKIRVPSGRSVLEISIAEGVGNCDLYVRYGAKPTLVEWDYRPYLSGNDESVKISRPQTGNWYIMLRARQPYGDVTLLADHWFSGSVTLLDSGVPETDISDVENGEKYFRLIVPSGQATLEIETSGGVGDADLYVKVDSMPTIRDYDYRPYQIGNDEKVTIENPPSGNYLIMVRGYRAYTGLTLVATFETGTTPGKVTPLTNGVPVTGLAGAAGSETFYKIDVPSGQASLEIAIAGGTGDVDMYIRKDAQPTTTEWDYRPYLMGNDEMVTINNPAAGTYYIMLKAYTAYTGVTLVATYVPVPDAVTPLTNGVPVPGLSAATGNEAFYKIVVPAGQDFLDISISGGTGDCDLYVKQGAKPTATSWDYRPYLIGNNETVQVVNPAPATWYIMLRAYQAYSGLTLVATYGSAAAGNDFSADPACVALWRFEPDELTTDSIGSNTLDIAEAPDVDTVEFREGEGAADTQYGYFRLDDADLDPGFPLKSGTATPEMSITFWMKAREGSTQATGAVMYAKGAEMGPYAYSFAVGLRELAGAGSGTIVLNVGTGDGTNMYKYDAVLPKMIQRDQWYHLTVTYQEETPTSGTLKLYVYDPSDDTVVTSTIVSAKIPVFNGPLAIGKLRWGTSRFNGWIDEVAVFNDVLTPAEIDLIRQGSYGKP